MLHDDCLCLVKFIKEQIKEVTSKIQSETRATSKRAWIRPLQSASVAFSQLEDKNEINHQNSKALSLSLNSLKIYKPSSSLLISRIQFSIFYRVLPSSANFYRV